MSRSARFLFTFVALLTWMPSAVEAQAKVGRDAPGFGLDRLGEGRLELAALRGRPVILNFWASWCAPCRIEMPQLVAAWKAHRDGGLEVVAVNLTDQERRKDVERFAEEMELPFPVVLDKRGRVREDYDLVSLPTTVFVDSAGIVRAVHSGPLAGDDLDAGLRTILPVPERPAADSSLR
jgi:thiol-disulfide isomerase/thioredoxin